MNNKLFAEESKHASPDLELLCLHMLILSSGRSRGGSLKPSSPPPVVKYPMKMKSFGLNETKLFHFHGIFKKKEIKSAKRTP